MSFKNGVSGYSLKLVDIQMLVDSLTRYLNFAFFVSFFPEKCLKSTKRVEKGQKSVSTSFLVHACESWLKYTTGNLISHDPVKVGQNTHIFRPGPACFLLDCSQQSIKVF